MSRNSFRGPAAALAVLLMGLVGCVRSNPAVGVLEINRDLPIVSSGVLRLGVTLNPGTTTGRDLLGGNLLVNGSFDLAPRLAVSLHVEADSTVTTPNGYRQFYPLPEMAYGWKFSDPRKTAVLRETGQEERDGSFFLHTTDLEGDTVRVLYSLRPIAQKRGARYLFRAKLRGKKGRMTVEFVRDSIGGKRLSNRVSFSPGADWRDVTGGLSVEEASERAFLQFTFESRTGEASDSLSSKAGVRNRTGSAFVDIDDVRLSAPGRSGLDSLILGLSPYYLRYPDGLTSGGFYPGTYPLHDTPENERKSIWTGTGYEYTGDFGLSDFLKLARVCGAQPVLLENAGITNAGAGRRYEDVALVPDRVKYLEQVLKRAGTDSLLLQIGYDMPSRDYPKRFRDMASQFEKDTVKPFLLSGGLIVPPDGSEYSDYVADYALPPLSSPSFIDYLPPRMRTSFSQPQPIMLGEVHFAKSGATRRFLPAFLLRAAFLIEAEKHADALKGLSLYPFLSEDKREMPLVLVRGGDYLPTALYLFCRAFKENRGAKVRSLDHTALLKDGIYSSLTSDDEEANFYLKAANTTRHPLTYDLKVLATNRDPFGEIEITRFSPAGISTDSIPDPYIDYTMSRERITLSFNQKTQITIGAYEAVLLHFK